MLWLHSVACYNARENDAVVSDIMKILERWRNEQQPDQTSPTLREVGLVVLAPLMVSNDDIDVRYFLHTVIHLLEKIYYRYSYHVGHISYVLAARKYPLGEFLGLLREDMKLTIEEFAEKLATSPTTLCRLETGAEMVDPRDAPRFAEMFGFSQETFLRLALQGILENDGLEDFTVYIEKNSRDKFR